jgi:hypothetical protein
MIILFINVALKKARGFEKSAEKKPPRFWDFIGNDTELRELHYLNSNVILSDYI